MREDSHDGDVVVRDLETLIPETADASTRRPGEDAARRRGVGDFERVGGGKPLRAGAFALAASLIFIVGALLKPWAGGPFTTGPATPRGSSRPSGPAAAAPSATPSVVLRAGGFDIVDLQSVDWTSLSVPDPHRGWGVSAATVAPVAHPPDSTPSLEPQVAWTAPVADKASGALTATIGVTTSSVFAIAVTWPSDVTVGSVSFTYVGPIAQRLDGFVPMADLIAVPASQDPSVGRAALDSPPTPQSGEFWIAPVERSVVPYIAPPAESWRFEPWWWPDGEYQVTVATGTGLQTLILRLQPE